MTNLVSREKHFELQRKLDNGEKPSEIFASVGKWSPEGIAVVALELPNKGNLNLWEFEDGTRFCYNYINTEHKLISMEWFSSGFDFSGGLVTVRSSDRESWNCMDTYGCFLFGTWYRYIGKEWSCGYILAQKEYGGKYCFLDKHGNVFCNRYFTSIDSFSDDGIAIVSTKDTMKKHYINLNGEDILDGMRSKLLYRFNDGVGRILREDDKYNLVNTDGVFILDEWYDYISPLENGIYTASNYKPKSEVVFSTYVDSNGKYICGENVTFDEVKPFEKFQIKDENGYFVTEVTVGFVRRLDKWNWVKLDGSLGLSNWVDTFAEVNHALQTEKSHIENCIRLKNKPDGR